MPALATNLRDIGDIYMKENDFYTAEEYLMESFKLSDSLSMSEVKKSSAEKLYNLYLDNENYKDALHFHTVFIEMKDEISNNDDQLSIKLKYKYDYEKQAVIDSLDFIRKAELSDLQLKAQDVKLNNSRMQKYALLGGIFLMAIFGVNLIYNYNRKKKDHILISSQHDELAQSHFDIKQSIDYSKRLQDAILPSEEEFQTFFNNHFVLNKPKDVVSGDFYWFEEIKEKGIKVLALADCTGHGVPGALVSVVCSNALSRAVNEFQCIRPSDILNKTRELVVKTFAKSGQDVRDGMDITLCCFEGNKVRFAMANNPLWLVRESKNVKDIEVSVVKDSISLIEFSPCRQSVGWSEAMAPFLECELDLIPGDTIYLMSDGYVDQFGGDKNKKYKRKNLKNLLLNLNQLPMESQKNELLSTFIEWKGKNEQIDDVCIIGIQVT